MDIPKAPGTGLFLDQLFFAGYNKKFGTDGMHEPLVWDKYQEALEQFREEHVLSHIAKSEVEESIMFQWLATLQYHKFDVIDLQQDVPPDGEKEKDPTWWKTKRLLRKLDKANAQPETEVAAESRDTTTSGEAAGSTTQDDATAATDGGMETKTDQGVAMATDDLTPPSKSSEDESEPSELPKDKTKTGATAL